MLRLGLALLWADTRACRSISSAWQAQHLREVRCRLRGRRSTLSGWRSGGRRSAFARSSIDSVARSVLAVLARVASPIRGQANWRVEIRGRRSAFARSGTDFVADAAPSQGQAAFARSGANFVTGAALPGVSFCRVRSGSDCVAGAALSQHQAQISWQHSR